MLGSMMGLKFGGATGGSGGQVPGGDGGGFNIPPDAGGGGSSGGFTKNYNTAAKVASLAGGVMGAVTGMPFGQSRAFAQAGASAGQRVMSNIGQAHQTLAQGGTSKPVAIGQATGALLGGATGAHVAGAAMAMGSRLLNVAPQDTASPGSSPAQDGPAMSQGRSQSSPGAATGAGGQQGSPAGGSGKTTLTVTAGNGGAARISLPLDRTTGLEDIIDFHRLTRR
jgi:hypothetical protein